MSLFDRNSDDFSDLVSDTSSNILKRNRKDGSVKSPLWDHFTVKNDLVTCNHCVPEKKFSGKTATINLKYHLEHKHPARFQDLDAKIKKFKVLQILSLRKINLRLPPLFTRNPQKRGRMSSEMILSKSC